MIPEQRHERGTRVTRLLGLSLIQGKFLPRDNFIDLGAQDRDLHLFFHYFSLQTDNLSFSLANSPSGHMRAVVFAFEISNASVEVLEVARIIIDPGLKLLSHSSSDRSLRKIAMGASTSGE